MSIRLMSKAFLTTLPASQKLVLIVMCDYANDDGLSCHPSVAQVAVKASLSDRQCKRVLKQLADDGYLSVIGNANGGKPGTTRHYQIDLERLETGAMGDTRTGDTHDTPTGDTHDTGDKLSRVTPEVETGDAGDMGGVTPRAKTGDTHVTQPTIDPSVEPPETHQCTARKRAAKKSFPEEFERCWSEYPKRAGGNSKRDACKAWEARVKAGADPDDILAGVQRYAAFCRITGKTGTEFVKQGATFFGPSEHYLDDWRPPSPGIVQAGRQQAETPRERAMRMAAERGIPYDPQ